MEDKLESLVQNPDQQIESMHEQNPHLAVYRARSGRVDITNRLSDGRGVAVGVYYYPPLADQQERLSFIRIIKSRDEEGHRIEIENPGTQSFTVGEVILSTVSALEMFRRSIE